MHALAGNPTLPLETGAITSARVESGVLKLQTLGTYWEITPCTPNMIRVRADRQPLTPDHSYSIVTLAKSNFAVISEKEDRWVVQTDSLRLEITKSPLRIRLFNAAGQLLNEDEPGLGTQWNGEEGSVYKTLQDGEKFIGLGEKTGHLDRRGDGFTNWNTDFFGYDSRNDPLYASFPFYMGLHHGLMYGIYLDNSSKTHFNFAASTDRFSSFTVEEGSLDYFLISSSHIPGILREYTSLTGRMTLPPLWSLGYQQCRYSYFPDKEVLNVARTFREKKIPADVIYLDIHYMDAYKVFTWHPERFSNPKGMIKSLKEMGFKTTVIIDPGIKVEKGYTAYEEGLKQDFFIKYTDGKPYTGQVWPGWCHFPDFTNAKARDWWGLKFKGLIEDGVEGFWNDMNEPATWGQRFPENVLFDFDGLKGTTRSARNIYGFQMTRGTYEGTRKLMGKRPFLLTRAAFSGSQRYTSIWTGDNLATDDIMLTGVRMVNSLGLAGMPFAGYDIGGFTASGSPELFGRWITIGAFAPFCRSHTGYNNRDAEPWAHGERIEDISRRYLGLRYKLLPYFYSLFYEASQTGMPISRSLPIATPQDEKTFYRIYQNQFLLGQSWLVCPTESTKELTKVYLPQGRWYNLHNGERYDGKQELMVECPLEKLPIFMKGPGIIPMQNVVNHTGEKANDTLDLHLFYGNENLEFMYYEDDGLSFDHEQGQALKRKICLDAKEGKIVLERPDGPYTSRFKAIRLILHGFEGFKLKGVGFNAGRLDLFNPENRIGLTGNTEVGPHQIQHCTLPWNQAAEIRFSK